MAFTFFTGNAEETINNFYTYQIQTETEVLYVGFGKLRDIFEFKKLLSLPSFDQTKNYTVIIHRGYPTRFEAANNSMRLVREIGQGVLPLFNKELGFNRGKAIICNETGVVYPSAYEACKLLKIHPPRMSNHLQGLKGHRTIHGLTFSYVR